MADDQLEGVRSPGSGRLRSASKFHDIGMRGFRRVLLGLLVLAGAYVFSLFAVHSIDAALPNVRDKAFHMWDGTLARSRQVLGTNSREGGVLRGVVAGGGVASDSTAGKTTTTPGNIAGADIIKKIAAEAGLRAQDNVSSKQQPSKSEDGGSSQGPSSSIGPKGSGSGSLILPGGLPALEMAANDTVLKVLPPPPASITAVFGSDAMKDLIMNWVEHAKKIPALSPYVVLAMDQELGKACEERSIPFLLADELVRESVNVSTNFKGYYRQSQFAFQMMGAKKAEFIRQLLIRGYDILMADADTVFFDDPWPVIGKPGVAMRRDCTDFAEADILVTSDMGEAHKDVDPANVIVEFNTGILFIRATSITVAFAEEWRMRSMTFNGTHDQTEFNRILRGLYTPGVICQEASCHLPYESWPYLPVNITSSDGKQVQVPQWRTPGISNELQRTNEELVAASFEFHQRDGIREVFWMWGRRIKVAVLPVSSFMSGHLLFVQRLYKTDVMRKVEEKTFSPKPSLIAPKFSGISVHCTFQYADAPNYVYGKRQRMRDAGIWMVDPPDYYTEGNYLRIVDSAPLMEQAANLLSYPPILRECESYEKSSLMNETLGCFHPQKLVNSKSEDLSKEPDPATPHLNVMKFTRMLLRNALALAEATGRTLILPPLYCYCDRSWWTNLDCRLNAQSKVPFPIMCPMDHQFDIEHWYGQGFRFRENSFLENPKTPGAVRDSRAIIVAVNPAIAKQANGVIGDKEFAVAAGSTFDVAANLGKDFRVLEVPAADLFKFSPRGFSDKAKTEEFNWKIARAFSYEYEFCSEERNPYIEAVARRGLSEGLDLGQAFQKYFNCSGTIKSQLPFDVLPEPFTAT